ncbi:EamA family transporter [Thiomonas bhubaneswarensis]|nr:EamA family transporter [Thiomonas bhubaneswarensis]
MSSHIPPLAYFAVLAGALLHAGWNVAIRAGADRRMETARLVVGGSLAALLVLPFLRQPAAAAWPHLLLTALLHVAYFGLLAAAYARARVAVSYPLMRGVAPVLVLVASIWLFSEPLRPLAVGGVAAVVLGVLLLRARLLPGEGGALRYALANAVVIAAYTLNDAAGARLSGAPMSYALWTFPLTALPTVWWLMRGRRLGTLLLPTPGQPASLRQSVRLLLRGMGGGASSLVSYALALWAMTVAPVGPVAALRETAMLFGLLLAWLFLGERPTRRGLLAVVCIALGAALLR